MRRKKEPERVEENVEDDVPYEFRDISTLAIPMDQQRGKWARPIVILTGGWYDTDKSIIPYKVDSTGRLDVVGVCPENQADGLVDESPPLNDTYYSVLSATEYVRLININLRVTWTVQPTSMTMQFIIDGVTHNIVKTNPASNTWHYPNWNMTGDFVSLTGTVEIEERAFMLEARSLEINVKVTGGTVSNLYSRLKYAKW